MDDPEQPLLEPAASKRRSTLLHVCPFILGNEFCERLAFYGLASNLVTYISSVMGGDPGKAAIQVSIFEGLCYTTPLIGAYLADSYWGRFKTILIFSLIYVMGIFILTASSFVPGLAPVHGQDGNTLQFSVLAVALATIALGTGGIKPNVSAFGADQFNVLDPQDAAEKESFFGFFYMTINIGSFIACTVVVYIQDSVSWTLGFAIPGAAMAVGVLLFVGGSGRYRHVHPTESPMSRVVKVVYAALHNRWKKYRSKDDLSAQVAPGVSSLHGGQAYSSLHPVPARRAASGSGKQQPAWRPSTLNGSGVLTPSGSAHFLGSNGSLDALPAGGHQEGGAAGRGYDALSVPHTAIMSNRWLEDAITEWQTSQGHLMQVGGGLEGYTPHQVEEVKLVLRLLPVFFTTIVYWTIYTQMGIMFVQQGTIMQHDFTIMGRVLEFPSASMGLFNTVAIILLIPVYDGLLEPALRRGGARVTLLQRMGAGMVVAVLAMLVAAFVEMWRLQQFWAQPDVDPQGRGGATDVSPLNIFWQVPQYFLIGMSEVLTSIGMLEFFYDQAPDVMRSCSMALCMLSSAIGSFLAGALVAIVQAVTDKMGQQWIPRDLNLGRVDLFFFFMAIIMAVNFVIYLVVAIQYEYKPVEHHRPDVARAHSSLVSLPPAPDLSAQSSILMPLPPRPARLPRQVTAPMGIGRRAAVVKEESDTEELLYGRSLAFIPASPALPPNFR